MMQDTVPAPLVQSQRRFQNLRTITALILREMSSTYGRSPGGYIWAVLEPLAMITVLSLAFSVLFRSPSLGTSFILFYATAVMPFRLYQNTQSVVTAAIPYSKALLAYPVVSFLDAVLARFILSVLTQLMVSYIILSGILMIVDVRPILDFRPIVASFAAAALLGFGAGAVNCLLFPLFPIWKSAWGAATRPLMILSGVLYIYEDLPEFAQNILWYNPLIHITGLARTGFFQYYEPSYISMTYVLTVSLICTVAGLLFLRRYYRRIMVI